MKRSRLSQILAGILVNSIYEMKNYPVVLISTVISPLSLLAIITFVSNGTLLGTAIAGGLIMIFFSSGIALQSDLSHLKNDFKLQDMIVSSPTTAKIYMSGMALAEIVYSIPGIAILAALMALFLPLSFIQIATVTLVLLLIFAVSVVLGFMLSTISSDVVQSYAFSRLLSLLFATLPPVYYPITYIPQPFNYLAYLSPTTYAAEIIHASIGYIELPTNRIILDWAILLSICFIIFLIALRKTRWKDT